MLWGILVFYGVCKKDELHFAGRDHDRHLLAVVAFSVRSQVMDRPSVRNFDVLFRMTDIFVSSRVCVLRQNIKLKT